ncbi:hypothetical protein D3C78_927580 [compost metagenome]
MATISVARQLCKNRETITTTASSVSASETPISLIVAATNSVVSNFTSYARSAGKRADKRSSSPRTASATRKALADGVG